MDRMESGEINVNRLLDLTKGDSGVPDLLDGKEGIEEHLLTGLRDLTKGDTEPMGLAGLQGVGADVDSSLDVERETSLPPLGESAAQLFSTLQEIQNALNDADSPRYGQALSRVQGSMLRLITERGGELSEEVVCQVASVIYETALTFSSPSILADVVSETLAATKQVALQWGQALHAAVLDRCQQSFEQRVNILWTDAPAKLKWFNLLKFLGELFNRRLLSDHILMFCIAELLGLPRRQDQVEAVLPDDRDLESVAELFLTCGRAMERRLNEYVVVAFFDRVAHFHQVCTDETLKLKLYAPLQHRRNGWPNIPTRFNEESPSVSPTSARMGASPTPPRSPQGVSAVMMPAAGVGLALPPQQGPTQTLPSPHQSVPSPVGSLGLGGGSMPSPTAGMAPSSVALLQQMTHPQLPLTGAPSVSPSNRMGGAADDDAKGAFTKLNAAAPAFVPGGGGDAATGRAGYGAPPEPLESSKERTVYVVGIDTSLPEKVLLEFVQSCGRLLKIRLCGDTNNRTIYGFFEYRTRREAQNLMDKDKQVLGKYILNCSWAKSAIRDAMSGTANNKVKVRNFKFDYTEEDAAADAAAQLEATELRESCLQQKNWMPKGRRREGSPLPSDQYYDDGGFTGTSRPNPHKPDQQIPESYYRTRPPAGVSTDGRARRGLGSPSGRSQMSGDGEEELCSPIAARLLTHLQDVPNEDVEKAEALIAGLGNDCSKDVHNARSVMVKSSPDGSDPLDIAVRALFLAVLSYEHCRKRIPIRILQACSKASRISAYKCWSEVFRELVATGAWEHVPGLWESIADALADCVSSADQLVQKTSLGDLCAPLRRTPEWERFRRALQDSLNQVGVNENELAALLPY
eukprot:TRINITY_DN11843_c0_g1_i1.p1 TRINITY_DN11843_c0_g1~~TRINITY_DN11843_c0_g1_i1.p1  ORF type:complete len:860 (+),score=306.81 TRINITY_DN11843_c0_g1_i1:129-2708(+)